MNKQLLIVGGILAAAWFVLSRKTVLLGPEEPSGIDASTSKPSFQGVLPGATLANSSVATYSPASLRQVASQYPSFAVSYGTSQGVISGRTGGTTTYVP